MNGAESLVGKINNFFVRLNLFFQQDLYRLTGHEEFIKRHAVIISSMI